MAGRENDRGRRRGGSAARAGSTGRRPHGVRRTRPRDGRPGKPTTPGRDRPAERRGRTIRAAAAFGLSTTRRAAVLAIVVCALALSVAVPLSTYLSQRDKVQIEEERAQQLREQVDGLERRRDELADPARIEAEARKRLRYVMPGETPYMVELPGDARREGTGDKEQQLVHEESWYVTLWNAVSE